MISALWNGGARACLRSAAHPLNRSFGLGGGVGSGGGGSSSITAAQCRALVNYNVVRIRMFHGRTVRIQTQYSTVGIHGSGGFLPCCGSGSGRFLPSQQSSRLLFRMMASSERDYVQHRQKKANTFMMYMTAVAVLGLGFTYAAVPLYRLFCQATGFAGEVGVDTDPEYIAQMEAVNDRPIKIKFNADTGATMKWDFRPIQKEVHLVPGETALAFYTATNPSDKPVIGISTYNVIPYDAGQYFNKIQCFCFEEQRLNPHEQVDMPVFFYIDPEFAKDPAMWKVDEITLSYTFFESKDADGLVPGQMMPRPSDAPPSIRE